jgi:hypothetical protein
MTIMRQRRMDRDGCRLKAGDIVRIIGVPDFSKMHNDVRAEIQGVFSHLVGQYKRITAFEWGEARLDFRISRGRHRGCHAVWIEPYLLKKRETPANKEGRLPSVHGRRRARLR